MDSEMSQSKSLDAKEAARLLHLSSTYNQRTKALEAALGGTFCGKYWPANYTADSALALGCLKVTQTIRLAQQAGF